MHVSVVFNVAYCTMKLITDATLQTVVILRDPLLRLNHKESAPSIVIELLLEVLCIYLINEKTFSSLALENGIVHTLASSNRRSNSQVL